MNVSQLEHADAFSDPLPCASTLDRMEDLFIVRRRELILIKNRKNSLAVCLEGSDRCVRLGNELSQAQLRLAENLQQIVEVAGRIYDEYAAVEISTR